MPGITADTKLMLHFKGRNACQTIWDDSDQVHCMTALAQAQVDTAIKKWSTGSLKLDGSLDSVNTPDSPDWDIVASNLTDRTVDFQARHNAIDEDGTYMTHPFDANNRWLLYYSGAVDGGLSFFALVTASPVIYLTAGARLAAADTFYHIALCKVANKYGLYVNGAQVAHVQSDGVADYTAALTIADDSFQSGQELAGYMDEVRIHNANYFGADPQADLSDTIPVPTEEYARAVAAAGVPPGLHLSRRLSL